MSLPQPALTKPAQLAQPTPVAPTTPVTPQPQTTATPTTPSVPKGHPCAYTHDTQCSPCAAQKIRSCSCSIQAPETGDVTMIQPMRGDP